MLKVRENLRNVAAGAACLAVTAVFLVSCDKSKKSCTCTETIPGQSTTLDLIPSEYGVANCSSLETMFRNQAIGLGNTEYSVSCK